MKKFEVYFRILKVVLWLLLNACYKVIQWLVWEVTGVNQSLRKASLAPFSQQAAQVMKVRAGFKFCQYLSPASIWDFLLTHESFEKPEYVLKEHITLYAVVGDEAIFVESDPKVKIWSSKTCSFSMVAQHDNALKVVRMPIETMHYLADKVGDPKGKLIFLSNCSRCGSTLVNQMFEATERVIAFAEPNCINFLSKVIDQKIYSTVYSEDLIRKTKSTIRLMCNIEVGKVDAYLMKICSPAMNAIPFLKEVFPDSSHLYLYREPVKVCQSLYRLSLCFYSINLVFRFGINSAFRFSNLMAGVGFPASKYRVKVEHYLAISMVHWCVHMRMYLDLRKKNMKIAAIKYEDIIKDPTNAMNKIFAYCHLDQKLVEKTNAALSWDSQVNTTLDRNKMKNLPLLPYTGSTKEECDAICQKYGFPPAEDFKLVDFTITHPTVSMEDVLKNK